MKKHTMFEYSQNPDLFFNKFSMIVAASDNNSIGKDNKLLWHLPNDLKRFKALTTNKIVIMGKNTFKSLPNGPLPGRINIILCNDDEVFMKEKVEIKTPKTGVIKLRTIDKIMEFIHNFEFNQNIDSKQTLKTDTSEFFVIGGGMIYNLFLPIINKLYLTKVHTDIEGDVKININNYKWETLSEESYTKDDKHKFDYTFCNMQKIK